MAKLGRYLIIGLVFFWLIFSIGLTSGRREVILALMRNLAKFFRTLMERKVKPEGWGTKQLKLLKKLGQNPVLMSMTL